MGRMRQMRPMGLPDWRAVVVDPYYPGGQLLSDLDLEVRPVSLPRRSPADAGRRRPVSSPTLALEKKPRRYGSLRSLTLRRLFP